MLIANKIFHVTVLSLILPTSSFQSHRMLPQQLALFRAIHILLKKINHAFFT